MHELTIYSPMANWKEGDYPVEPVVCIQLSCWSCGPNGEILLTPNLISSEVDYWIDISKEQIEEMREPLKRELYRVKAKHRAYFKKKYPD